MNHVDTADQVAEDLHGKYNEAMMAAGGESMTFNVIRVPGSDFVQIRIGEYPLWDTEDNNDGEEQTPAVVMAYCKEQLCEYADMFAVFKTL